MILDAFKDDEDDEKSGSSQIKSYGYTNPMAQITEMINEHQYSEEIQQNLKMMCEDCENVYANENSDNFTIQQLFCSNDTQNESCDKISNIIRSQSIQSSIYKESLILKLNTSKAKPFQIKQRQNM